mmetsp:Transcript_5088/g.14204  ORF Transcript_5088/g.14204 Transcript_5088/m.14204 type:complete len:331 (+) Transcript_5088:1398-2390(+)
MSIEASRWRAAPSSPSSPFSGATADTPSPAIGLVQAADGPLDHASFRTAWIECSTSCKRTFRASLSPGQASRQSAMAPATSLSAGISPCFTMVSPWRRNTSAMVSASISELHSTVTVAGEPERLGRTDTPGWGSSSSKKRPRNVSSAASMLSRCSPLRTALSLCMMASMNCGKRDSWKKVLPSTAREPSSDGHAGCCCRLDKAVLTECSQKASCSSHAPAQAAMTLSLSANHLSSSSSGISSCCTGTICTSFDLRSATITPKACIISGIAANNSSLAMSTARARMPSRTSGCAICRSPASGSPRQASRKRSCWCSWLSLKMVTGTHVSRM